MTVFESNGILEVVCLTVESIKHLPEWLDPGMPIFRYFPFFPLFFARNLYVNIVYFLLFHHILSELSVSFCVHFL